MGSKNKGLRNDISVLGRLKTGITEKRDRKTERGKDLEK